MSKRLNQTTLITLSCLSFLVGLAWGRTTAGPWSLVVGGLLLLALVWRSRWRWLVIITLLLCLGLARGSQVAMSDRQLQAYFGQEVQVTGVVKDDTALNDHNQLSFMLGLSQLNGHPYHAVIGIYTYRTSLHRNYRLIATGKLKPALGAAQGELSFPQLEVVSNHLNWLERRRLDFLAAVRSAIPEPMASFALGLLIGARALIPKALQVQLAAVGLSHLVAVSGYNLTILVNAIPRSFRRLSKFMTFGLSLWIIAGFVAVAGATASIMRAALVSVLVLAAAYYGRRFKPWLLVALVAALTAGLNPHSLWSDLGWQLSFAAFIGVLILAPAMVGRLNIEDRAGLMLLVETLAAYFMTLPLLLHSFGSMALMAPLANLVIMPLVPLAMLLSFLAGILGWLVPALSGWVGWPATLLLRFMVGLIQSAAHIKPTKVTAPTSFLIIWYGLMAIFSWALSHHTRPLNWYNKEERNEEHVRTFEVA